MSHPRQPSLDLVIVTKHRPISLVSSVAHIVVNSTLCTNLIIIDSSQEKWPDEVAVIQRLCDAFRVNLNYRQVPASTSLPKARNLGLKLSSSQYVGFVDDDEFVSKEWISKLLAFLVEKKAVCVTQPKRAFYKNNYWNRVWEAIELTTFKNYFPYFGGAAGSSIYDNAFLKRHRIRFEEGLLENTAEDRLFSDRVMSNGGLIYAVKDVNVYHTYRTDVLSFAWQWFQYGRGMANVDYWNEQQTVSGVKLLFKMVMKVSSASQYNCTQLLKSKEDSFVWPKIVITTSYLMGYLSFFFKKKPV